MPYPAIYYITSIYYPVLAGIGIPVNVVAIVILSRGECGLSRCITRYLVGMAAADFMVVVIAIVMEQINLIYSYSRFLHITPVCALTLLFKIASKDCSVWLTVAFTFDRCIAITSQNLRNRYCTERTATIVIIAVGILSCLRCIPFYFVMRPQVIIDNVPFGCIPVPEYYTSLFWKAHEMIDSIITPLLPICFILLFNGLTTRHIIAANKIRRGLRTNNDNQKDAEVENRRKSMILLFALSANFLLLWLPYVIHSMNWQTVNISYKDKYLNTSIYIMQQCAFMLQFLSTCTNTCIYTLTQKKFREELKKGVKYVLTVNGQLSK